MSLKKMIENRKNKVIVKEIKSLTKGEGVIVS